MFASQPQAVAGFSSSAGRRPSRQEQLPPGVGHIHLGPSSLFRTLAFCYPLKLISPTPLPSSPAGLRVAYVLSYGGGLVGGDRVWLDVDVEEGAKLVLLTQGTTKVFRSRPVPRLATSSSLSLSSHASAPGPSLPPTALQASTTSQQLIANVAASASLFLLPSPTSCFAEARFTQRQRVNLPICGTATVVVLDWFNSGRTAAASLDPTDAAELWEAERMEFYLELWWGPRRGLLERLVLASADRASLAPYTLFGTLVLAGPDVQTLIARLESCQAAEERITRSLKERPGFMWSLSIVEARVEGMAGVPCTRAPAAPSTLSSSTLPKTTPVTASVNKTAVLRVCGIEAETVKDWLGTTLGPGKGGLAELIGAEMWERAMS